jgi:putative sterol carrier protein
MRITGSYKTFQKLNRGEMSAMQAIMKKVYKIEGSMPQIMAKMGPIQAMANVMAAVPVEYEEV